MATIKSLCNLIFTQMSKILKDFSCNQDLNQSLRGYFRVSNKRAGHLFVYKEFFLPTCPYLRLNNSKKRCWGEYFFSNYMFIPDNMFIRDSRVQD